MSGRHPLATRQRLEVLGGFVAFFATIALINAGVLILRGRPSVLASAVLVFFLVLAWVTFRAWRKVDDVVNKK